MEWSHLKVLLALQRGGSIAGAARELKVDHSTVSRQLSALEEAVGAQLLIRGGSSITWTAQGSRLLEAALQMDAAASDAMREVRGVLADVTGSVHVSVPTGYLPILIRLALPRLEAECPGFTVKMEGTYQQVDLARGGADIAIRMARPKELDLVAKRAFTEAWFAYASERYIARRGLPENMESLPDHDLVLYAERLHGLEPLGWPDRFSGDRIGRIHVDTIEAAAQIVAAGGGVAVLPAFVAHDIASAVRVFDQPVAVKEGWIVFHETLRGTARIRAVIDVLTKVFRENKSVFMGSDSPPTPS